MHNPPDRQPALAGTNDGAQAVPASELLTTLAHEMRNLLDGSMRCLGNAERILDSAAPDAARDQLSTVRGALERMIGLLNTAMHNAPGVLGSPEMAVTEPVRLGEAIEHALEVMRPLATASGVELVSHLEPEAAHRACGTLYPLILNGVRNGIEAIAICRPSDQSTSGFGQVSVELASSGDGGVVLRITDDGIGPPPNADTCVYAYGYTTKQTGSGIGLAVAATIVRELPGASITLRPRTGVIASERVGAVLEVRTGPKFDQR
jgi:signal transduction histidine kinase